MKCNHIFCPHEATSNVFIQFRTHKNHDPAISSRVVSLCDNCATAVTWDYIMPNDQFEQICRQFELAGRARPVKEYCNILIEPIINELPGNNCTISQ
jgi:hypothetical protein